MEKNKTTVPVWISAVLFVLCIAMIGLEIVSLIGGNEFPLMRAAAILSYVAVLIYCIAGYRKGAAFFYKLFLACYLVVPVISIVYMLPDASAGQLKTAVLIVLDVIRIVCVLLLLFAKDLGKKRSFFLGGAAVICAAIGVILSSVNGVAAVRPVINVVFANVVLLVVLYAKYRDKEARGTT